MKASLCHMSINVSDVEFYRKLLTYLGFRFEELEDGFGAIGEACSIWVFKVDPQYIARGFHRKAIGLNHIALRVGSKSSVDKFYKEFLKPKNIPVLYNSPKPYPEYAPDYYAVFFEDPDRIKLEVVFDGPSERKQWSEAWRKIQAKTFTT